MKTLSLSLLRLSKDQKVSTREVKKSTAQFLTAEKLSLFITESRKAYCSCLHFNEKTQFFVSFSEFTKRELMNRGLFFGLLYFLNTIRLGPRI